MGTSKNTRNTSDAATAASSNLADFNAVKESFTKISDSELARRSVPPRIIIGEAETLYRRAMRDAAELTRVGLSLETIELLQPASGALRHAQAVLSGAEEGNNSWRKESPEAFEVRDRLFHALLFAYRRRADIRAKLRAAAKGNRNEDMVQQLANYSELGREHKEELKHIGFDFTLLDKAAALSARMGDLLGEAKAEKRDCSSERRIRDQAYTYLKRVIAEVREYGKYVFYRDDERSHDYACEYTRNKKRKTDKEKEEIPEAVEVPEMV